MSHREGNSSSNFTTDADAVLLPKLRELSLGDCTLASTSTLLQLTQLSGTTSLCLDTVSMASAQDSNAGVLPSAVSAVLQHLPDLVALVIRRTNANFATMSTTLQQLELEGCQLLDPAADLAAIGRLQQLRHLSLKSMNFYLYHAENIMPEHFSALTASSHLTVLRMYNEEHQPLPRGAVECMFSSGKRLPKLQVVGIEQGVYVEGSWCITAPELRSMVNACPVLTSLNICNTLQPAGDISALLQLPASCSRLENLSAQC